MIRRNKGPAPEPEPQSYSFRCSTCALNYPNHVFCKVCGGATHGIQHQPPTPDIDYHVELMLADLPEELDSAFGWRTECLVKAGAPMRLAERIAANTHIDLHQAVTLMTTAGPELAREILL